MTTHRKKKAGSVTAPPPPQWIGTEALGGVRILNAHFLEVLVKWAANKRATCLPPFMEEDRETWTSLTASARARAAQHSMLLLDIRFQDEAWWRSALRNENLFPAEQAASGGLPRKRAAKLARETLMLAWPTARMDRKTAMVLFGMSDEVADLVAMLNPQQIDRIAERYSHSLRPRWENRSAFWHGLLQGARAADEQALRDTQCYGLQLLAGELLRGRVEHESHARGFPS